MIALLIFASMSISIASMLTGVCCCCCCCCCCCNTRASRLTNDCTSGLSCPSPPLIVIDASRFVTLLCNSCAIASIVDSRALCKQRRLRYHARNLFLDSNFTAKYFDFNGLPKALSRFWWAIASAPLVLSGLQRLLLSLVMAGGVPRFNKQKKATQQTMRTLFTNNELFNKRECYYTHTYKHIHTKVASKYFPVLVPGGVWGGGDEISQGRQHARGASMPGAEMHLNA